MRQGSRPGGPGFPLDYRSHSQPAEKLAPLVADYRARAAEQGREVPQIVTYTSLPLEDRSRSRDIINGYEDAGVTTLVYGRTYQQSSEIIRSIEVLQQLM